MHPLDGALIAADVRAHGVEQARFPVAVAGNPTHAEMILTRMKDLHVPTEVGVEGASPAVVGLGSRAVLWYGIPDHMTVLFEDAEIRAVVHLAVAVGISGR